MEIRFGALSEPLHEQLGLPEEDMKLVQRLADAVTLCNIHGILPDGETHKARKRIVKEINRVIKKLEG